MTVLCVYMKDISALVMSMRRSKEVCAEHPSQGHPQAIEIHLRSVMTIESRSLRILGLIQGLVDQRKIFEVRLKN